MSLDDRFPLKPGSTIGIIGGGQLGRMTALAAAPLGYRCHIFTPEVGGPAEQVSATTTNANYDDMEALIAFADSVDVVTFEFENVPFESVQALSERVPVRPGWDVLRISQDRLVEKDFINNLGIPTTPYKAVSNLSDLEAAVAELGRPSVLKTTRMGYDGKGQTLIAPDTDLSEAWNIVSGGKDTAETVLEAFVDLALEVSVVIARGADGAMSAYPPVDNHHKNHILDITRAPAGLEDSMTDKAIKAAETIISSMNMVGLLAVEMFITKSGELLINEIAPRPHNSGHWTQDACHTSQFEQFVRAVAGLPFGSTERHHDAVMTNLIGDDVEQWHDVVGEDGSNLHLYGKAEARAGRKMGHVNRLYPLGELPKL